MIFPAVGARNSADASNLFSGLLFDITIPDDTRGMQFAIKGKKYKHSYLTSAWRAGKKAHRVCYEKFEKAFLGFLSELDWKAVAGQSETNDLKQSSADLDKVTADIVKLSSTIDNSTLPSMTRNRTLRFSPARLVKPKVGSLI